MTKESEIITLLNQVGQDSLAKDIEERGMPVIAYCAPVAYVICDKAFSKYFPVAARHILHRDQLLFSWGVDDLKYK